MLSFILAVLIWGLGLIAGIITGFVTRWYWGVLVFAVGWAIAYAIVHWPSEQGTTPADDFMGGA
jgi:hypothetical protein